VIERIRIENFRLFKNFEMDGVKQINLISGANNVGKTSLLEAIMIYDSPIENIKSVINNRKHSDFSNQSFDIKNLFNNTNQRCDLSVSIDGEKRSVSSYDIKTNGFVANFDPIGAKYIRDIYNSNLQCEHFSPVADNNNKRQKLIEILKELEPRINDLRLGYENGNPYISADVGLPVNLSIHSLGDGINKLLTILLTALRDDCKILLLDEIETGFHYSFYPKLWNILAKLAKETGCQIFATTHSYECIEGAKELNQNEPELFGFFRLDRDTDGNIIPKAFTQSMFETSFENGWEVR
jgi:AAA15 family ATPase/GTPase